MKMMLRRLAIVVCVALALLSAAYAFAVLRTHSGTGFWTVSYTHLTLPTT